MKHPVILVIDNDSGAKDIISTLAKNYDVAIDLKSSEPFFHVTDNLYLVKTPEKGSDGVSCIEDFFDPSLLQTELEGKKFNPNKEHGADGEYGKFVFAEKVVRPNASTINFSEFKTLLGRIVSVIDHYSPPTGAAV